MDIFHSMQDKFGVVPDLKHLTCVVDALGRAGRLEEAEQLAKSVEQPDFTLWMTLLGACKKHKDADRAKFAAARALEIQPHSSSVYVLLSSTLTLAGRFDEANAQREKIKELGLKVRPCQTWLEVDGKAHSFYMDDHTHPDIIEINEKIKQLRNQVEQTESIQYDTSCVAQQHLSQSQKIERLWRHSEKLAIAFALCKTSQGEDIFIIKNLRICTDCHNVIKVISKLVKRRIIIRDSKCFHIFAEGECSCNNYW